jgi:hypothetical protein
MTVKKILTSGFTLSVLWMAAANSQTPSNLQEAKALSAQSGKPLLMEFVRPG